ncbi:MAG: DEAD/DEAH box helicase family protein, partial [Bacillota bacterium]
FHGSIIAVELTANKCSPSINCPPLIPALHFVQDGDFPAGELNLKDVRVFDAVYEDNVEKRVLNKKETAVAQQKQEAVKEAFQSWIWKDPQRRERLTRLYNDRFNSVRPRDYDGSHIRFTGMNPEITLRKHQVDAVARILYGGNTLLAHCVGAGKTYAMTAAAMESKHLGLCSKSLFVVPNHLTEQWAGRAPTTPRAEEIAFTGEKRKQRPCDCLPDKARHTQHFN